MKARFVNVRSGPGQTCSIDEPVSPVVIAALKKAASGPIAAWQAKVAPEAVAILDWANQQ